MARKPSVEIPEETARILFLAYGHDAVEMAELRCSELQKAGDKQGAASWTKVLKHVRTLAAANPEQRGTTH